MLAFLLDPYRVDRFRFDRTWWQRGLARFQTLGGNARHLAVPPAWLWLQRSIAGLHAVLLKLDVAAPLAEVLHQALAGRDSRGRAASILR